MRLLAQLPILIVLTLLLSQAAWAQPAEPAASTDASPAAKAEAKPAAKPAATTAPAETAPAETVLDEPEEISREAKAQARRHFAKGIKLLREEAWAPSLAEFKLSRDLFPTRVATINAAVTLRRLQRYDEALEMYETLLRDFKVKLAQREDTQRKMADLHALVGTIDISGAEPGASIVISSKDRGQFPAVKPIRVPSGNHIVRVFKEGFEPFETRIDVAGGKLVSVSAPMAKLKDSGKLRVSERSGRTLGVVVDGVSVGKTPWQGTLSVGDHTVMLRGTGKLGSQPSTAKVQSQQLTQLSLLAEDLDASLRVDPTPPGASVWINSVNVGNGVWLGRLKTGTHTIEVKAEGFVDDKTTVELARGKRESLVVELDRDEDAPRWQKPSKWTLDGTASVLLAPTFGGDLADSCGDGCTNSMGIGGIAQLHGSYELGSGLGFGIELGYLIASKSVDGRAAQLNPIGLPSPNTGVANDDLRLQGFMAGATLGYHFGGQIPVQLQVGAGVLAGQLRDERRGVFDAQNGDTYEAFPVADFQNVTYIYIDPTLRVGYQVTDNIELTVQVQALLLIGLSKPKWDQELELNAGSDGVGSYSEETLMGDFVGMIAPGFNLRYTFGDPPPPDDGTEAVETAKR
jgi:hypothetical protein